MSGQDVAIIVGAGSGLSASLARRFSRAGMKVALAARDTEKLAGIQSETGAHLYACDTVEPDQVNTLFDTVVRDLGTPTVVVSNASSRVRGAITEINPDEVKRALLITTYGGFLVGQAAAKLMVPGGGGTIMFTGASAGVKGFPNSSVFAMGKFGLRGLSQSLARELHPKNIHIGHFVIDGAINTEPYGEYQTIHPDEIAKTYLQFHKQNKSSWAWEIELRTSTETF